jgi:hypothetical protein
MSLWKLNKPPIYHPTAIATPAGWADPITGELLVAITGLSTFKEVGGLTTLVDVYLDKVSYLNGDVMTLTVQYSEPVVVTGTPHLTLVINGTNHTLNYTAGSGTAFITFAYTVTQSDVATATQVAVTSPVSLNGGTIKSMDDASKAAPLTFTPNASVAKVTVDGVLALVSSVTGISGAYVTAGTITATVAFNRAVTVTGTPQIAIAIGSNNRKLNYASGTGTTSLTFTYPVVSGDAATAGQVVVTSPITLNGGTMKDSNKKNATLTFTAPDTSAVTVN